MIYRQRRSIHTSKQADIRVRAGDVVYELFAVNVKKRFCFWGRRALLVYCLRHYKGDDKIKSFIWDLITPTKEGQDQALLNHSG